MCRVAVSCQKMPPKSNMAKEKTGRSRETRKGNTTMGAPPKLSASQLRKLVRLYFYIGMAFPNICTVLSVGHEVMLVCY